MLPGVIIPCHNTEYLDQILRKLERQQCLVAVVLDRIEYDRAVPSNVTILRNDDGEGFLGGKCRDIGLDYFIPITDKYIFIDCDCIPQDNLVESHNKWLSLTTPICTLGRRLESKYGWNDKRADELMNLDLFNDKGTIVNNANMIKQCLALWSCNFGLNRYAAVLAKRLMVKYFGTSRVFHPAFDGKWGGEDSFLGYIVWSCRTMMYFLPNGANAVSHMDHPQLRTIEYKKVLDELVKKLSIKLNTDRLTPDFFICNSQ